MTFLSKVRRLELVLLCIVVLYILAAPFIFPLLLPRYVDSLLLSQVASVILLFAPRSLITAVFKARMRKKELIIVRLGGAVLRLIGLAVGILWGLMGVVIALVIVEGLLYLLYYVLFMRMRE